jgi:hypothetical protein
VALDRDDDVDRIRRAVIYAPEAASGRKREHTVGRKMCCPQIGKLGPRCTAEKVDAAAPAGELTGVGHSADGAY